MNNSTLRSVGTVVDTTKPINLLILPTRHIEAGKVGITFHCQLRAEWDFDFDKLILVPAACVSVQQIFKQFKDISLNATGAEALLQLQPKEWQKPWLEHTLYFPATSFLTKTGEKMMMVRKGKDGPESALVDFNDSPAVDVRIPMFIK
ncbi:MAG: hypothetical protein AAB618_03390 [Patescibacteria group bacterium]